MGSVKTLYRRPQVHDARSILVLFAPILLAQTALDIVRHDLVIGQF
jgi:hypothetical protein